MPIFEVSKAWKSTYPEAHAGVLVMRGVANPSKHAELDKQKSALEEELRDRYSALDRKALEEMPTLQAYHDYYKRFDKSYHVQLQLESIVFKGKSFPKVAALVEAMFMAEVKNMLLTAGHDYEKLQLPITLDVASGSERYILMGGQEQTLKSGDMFMADRLGITSSILYGPDQRTQITNTTRHAAFSVYAPAGITPQQLSAHLEDIQKYVQVVAPQARMEYVSVFGF
jgi:DNA/RNA-binding domain of Phe-tRNA-synthetase-like protein